MKRFAATCVAFAMTGAPLWAQVPAQVPPLEQNRGGASAQQVSPSEGNTTTADLTGQAVYSAKGRKLGMIAAMSTGNHGEQSASVAIASYPGMSGKTVLIPVSSLRPRGAGGYLTTLSSTELKALPAAGTGQTQ